MSEKLEPCPFCGGEISLKHHEFEGGETLIAFVCPEGSICRQHKNGLLFVAQSAVLEAAIKLWNTRADQPAKKVYRAGDVVPDGWYWAEECPNQWTPVSVTKKGRLLCFIYHDEPDIYRHREHFLGCLIPIDPPEGVGAND